MATSRKKVDKKSLAKIRAEAGSKGGKAVVRKKGREHLAAIGSKGGNSTLSRYGRDFFLFQRRQRPDLKKDT